MTNPLTGRLDREARTINAMLRIYCRDHHPASPDAALCPSCQTLADYAALRLTHCRFGQAKPTCANCPVHCYKSALRIQVREVMRYAGPRMLYRHPLLAIQHLWDGRKKGRGGRTGGAAKR